MENEGSKEAKTDFGGGVLPDWELEYLIGERFILGKNGIQISGGRSAIRPASLDLTLGDAVYLCRGSTTPKKGQPVRTIADDKSRCIQKFSLLDKPAVLKKNHTYLARLNESLELPKYRTPRLNYGDDCINNDCFLRFGGIEGRTTTKSTIGRLGVFTRGIVDGESTYDIIPKDYRGELWLEISPLAFDIQVKMGDSLAQMILYCGLDMVQLRENYGGLLEEAEKVHFLRDRNGKPLNDSDHITREGIFLTVDLGPGVVVYCADDPGIPIDISAENYYDPKLFWYPESPDENGSMMLANSKFYIMQSRERLAIPQKYAAEVYPFHEPFAEARIHYAAFVNPGSGYTYDGNAPGTTLVLEVIPRDVPMTVWDGRPFAKLDFHRMFGIPKSSYNRNNGSYNDQGRRTGILSKVFRQWG